MVCWFVFWERVRRRRRRRRDVRGINTILRYYHITILPYYDRTHGNTTDYTMIIHNKPRSSMGMVWYARGTYAILSYAILSYPILLNPILFLSHLPYWIHPRIASSISNASPHSHSSFVVVVVVVVFVGDASPSRRWNIPPNLATFRGGRVCVCVCVCVLHHRLLCRYYVCRVM